MEEKMNQIFVGKKYEKFEKKVFSIPAFFFGGIYFAYRKMLLHGLLITIFTGILDTLASKLLSLGFIILQALFVRIALGLYFPIWYRKFYTSSVKKIISFHQQSEEKCITCCQKKGGTSIAIIILFIILGIFINLSISSTLDKFILHNADNNLSSNIILNNATTNSDSNDKEDSSNSNSQTSYPLGISEDTFTLVDMQLLKFDSSVPEGETYVELNLLLKNSNDELLTINYKENDSEKSKLNLLLSNRQYEIKFETREEDNDIIYSVIDINFINSIVDNEFSKTFESKIPNSENQHQTVTTESGEFKFLEKVKIYGYKSDESNYLVYINDAVYECSINNYSMITLLKYTTEYDELFANIYYTEKDSSKTIDKIELCNIITGEILEDISDEDSIRQSLGYHLEGTHNDIFTLVEKDEIPGDGRINSTPFKFYNLIFQSEYDKKQFEFTYRVFDDTTNRIDELKEGEEYNITFDVEERISGYDYVLTDFEKI